MVQTFRFKRGHRLDPSLQLLDEWDMMENPHGDLDKDEELGKMTSQIYASKAPVTHLKKSFFI